VTLIIPEACGYTQLCITMRTFLFPTDFSGNAKHALSYGYNLAKQVKANVIICNVIIEPAEIPQSGMVSWPMEESDKLLKDSEHELEILKKYLEGKEETISFNPAISCISEAGTVTEIINNVSRSHNIGLVVAGTHSNSGLGTLLLGNHAIKMIDFVKKPLLLIPSSANIVSIHKIAFATDFKNPEHDLECILTLTTLARPLNAEILVTHIVDGRGHDSEFQSRVDKFMVNVSDKVNYPHIYYRVVNAKHTNKGLEWLCNHGTIDIMAMVHRSHNFFNELFNGSHTQKMVKHIAIPLLVFPSN
jgi:nucleotide-binding universal stress UspA family protein